jgi:DNA polymerase-3 subunit epsilon
MGLFGKLFGRGSSKQVANQQQANRAASSSKQARQLQPIHSRSIDVSRIVVDVETTGLSSSYDEILQLAICNGNGEPVWNQLYKPRRVSSWDEASRIHGIYPRDVNRSPFIAEDISTIQVIFDHSTEIVIYNADFDVSFLEAAGLKVDGSKVVDAMKEYATFCGEQGRGGKWRKLEEAARETGYGSFGAHDALEDVRATAHVLRWTESQRQAIEDANPIRIEEPPRCQLMPELDPEAFCFVAREFQCDEVRKVNKATGAVLESEKTFYADGALIKKLYDDIRALEKLVDRVSLGIPEDAVKAKRNIRASETITERTPTFEVTPLTATGKKPKFAMKASLAESRWDTKRNAMLDGVNAELYYLQGGTLGKARLRYFVAGNIYDVQFKEEKKKAVLSRIDFTEARTWNTTRLF